MKIGKFSELNKISKDTIRYYMEFGLIFPNKKGAHFDFDERCQESLDEIIELKNLGFSLSEIKDILAYLKIGKLTIVEKNELYKNIFINKQQNIIEKINHLTSIKDNLENYISNKISAEYAVVKKKYGVPISFLENLRCPNCKSNLILNNGAISDNQVTEGSLTCHCGKEIEILDGILKVPSKKEIENYDPYIAPDDLIKNYVENTDSKYVENISKGLEWLYANIPFDKFSGKVIAEFGSGLGIFLRYFMDEIPDDSIYIAIDHDIERHIFLKSIVEEYGINKNIIFICSDFLELPIKENLIDVIIDYSGTTAYSFTNENFLLELIDNYLSNNCYLIGSFILFKKFSINSFIKQSLRKNFMLENIKNKIESLGYKTIIDTLSDEVERGGKYEDFFVEGEIVFSYVSIAVK